MKFCVIGSGSKGNLTYIETKTTKVLLDAGISILDAKRRNPDIDYSEIDAVFITHEHSDHRKFLGTIVKNTNATLYINKLSFDKLPYDLKVRLTNRKVVFIEANKKYKVKDLEILTLEMSHDSASILGFVFISEDKKLAIITDTGFIPIQYINILKEVDALVIEANHDVKMLMESNRDWYLKERILSPTGHMSNYICGQLLQAILNSRHKVVVLAHVSLECNSIEIIENDIIKEVRKTYSEKLDIASQYEATELYII
jgi:phosphoribosyl 1,2-cyclic phosphodiesterase